MAGFWYCLMFICLGVMTGVLWSILIPALLSPQGPNYTDASKYKCLSLDDDAMCMEITDDAYKKCAYLNLKTKEIFHQAMCTSIELEEPFLRMNDGPYLIYGAWRDIY